MLLPDFVHCSQLTIYASIQAGKLAAIAPSKEKKRWYDGYYTGDAILCKRTHKAREEKWIDAYPSPAPTSSTPTLQITKTWEDSSSSCVVLDGRGSIRSWGTCRHIPPNHAIVSRFPGLDVNAWVVRASPHPSKAESICTVQDPLPLLIHHARWGGEGPNPPIIHSDRSRKRAFPRIHGGTSMS